ncbi:MAG: putative toxin-antitoxin system toxin component, PIN family [Thermomicrobiales bacterium]
MHRIVPDTNLLVSGLIVPHGLPHRLIAAWRDGDFHLLVTDAILAEYATVLARPRFAEKYGLTSAVVAALLRRMRSEGMRVTPVATIPIAVRDPKDVHLLAAALGGSADYLVTGDDDLLVLDGRPALNRLRILTVRAYFNARVARVGKSDA